MERGGRRRRPPVGGERAREMAIGAGGDGSADNSSVALPPSARRRRPVLRVAIRPCAELAFLLRPPLLSFLPSFLLLSWGNRKILFLAFPPILSQWLWAGREENTPVCVRPARQTVRRIQSSAKANQDRARRSLKTRLKLQL